MSPKRQRPDDGAGLSQDRIVDAAITLLDAHGVEGLSMRRLASALGAGAMSLYWHVETKEAVLDLALDRVLAYRPPDNAGSEDWRSAVNHLLEDWRATMLRHPWSASLLPRRALGPSILARLERLGSLLAAAGVPERNLNVAIWSLWNHVMGATVTRGGFDRSAPDRAGSQGPSGADAAYPTIARSRLLSDDDWDGAFRSGLGFLLDGLVPRR